MKQTQPKITMVNQAPPFDGNWNFIVVKTQHETPEQDYYSCSANHDEVPGSGDGFGYLNGRNQGFFRAGLGDVPLPEDTPVGWWAYQHNFQIGPTTKIFTAKFEVQEIIFKNNHGYDVGGSAQVWAAIMQCQIDPNKNMNDYNVLDAAVVPVTLDFTGHLNVAYEAKLSNELNITNPEENYAFRIGWIVQIRYKDAQSCTLSMKSMWHEFNFAQPLASSSDAPPVKGPEKAKSESGLGNMNFQEMPKGFVSGGKIVGA